MSLNLNWKVQLLKYTNGFLDQIYCTYGNVYAHGEV